MVWTADQMADSYGNAMPDSYYETGRSEYTQFMTDVGEAEERWSRDLKAPVVIDVVNYVSSGQVSLAVWISSMRLAPFSSLYELESYLERMYP